MFLIADKIFLALLATIVLTSCVTGTPKFHRYSPETHNNNAPIVKSSQKRNLLSILDEFLQKKSLKTINDIVQNSVDENIRHDIQRSFEYMSFSVFRHVIIFSLPLFNRKEYDNILIDFYYGKNNKNDRTPKELFLDAYKKGAMSFPKKVNIGVRVQSYSLDENNKCGKIVLETFHENASGMIFTYLILFKISKKNGREFWLPYDMKNIATADIQQYPLW